MVLTLDPGSSAIRPKTSSCAEGIRRQGSRSRIGGLTAAQPVQAVAGDTNMPAAWPSWSTREVYRLIGYNQLTWPTLIAC